MRIFLNSTGLHLFTLIGGVILPLIVDLVTKSTTAPKVKAVLLLLLTLASSAVADLLAADSDGWDWSAWGWISVPTFIIAVASLFGIHMPTGLHRSAKTALTG